MSEPNQDVSEPNKDFEKPKNKVCLFVTGMDELMEVSFSPIAETGKPLSRCGKCHRFMKYIQVGKKYTLLLNFDKAYVIF